MSHLLRGLVSASAARTLKETVRTEPKSCFGSNEEASWRTWERRRPVTARYHHGLKSTHTNFPTVLSVYMNLCTSPSETKAITNVNFFLIQNNCLLIYASPYMLRKKMNKKNRKGKLKTGSRSASAS
jgi:hypothetical protein